MRYWSNHSSFFKDLIFFLFFFLQNLHIISGHLISETSNCCTVKFRRKKGFMKVSKGSWRNDVEVLSTGTRSSRLLFSRNWKQCRETKHSARRCSLYVACITLLELSYGAQGRSGKCTWIKSSSQKIFHIGCGNVIFQ